MKQLIGSGVVTCMTLASLLLLSLPVQGTTPRQSAVVDASTIAQKLSDASTGSVVVVANDSRISWSDDPAAALKAGGARLTPGKPNVVGPDHLPLAWMSSLTGAASSVPAMKTVEVPAAALTANGVTYASVPGENLSILSLTKLAWGRPLVISNAFENVNNPGLIFAVNVQNVDPVEFLRSVAKAVGGRFRQADSSYIIEPNGSELKDRAVKSVTLLSNAIKDAPKTGAQAVPGDGGVPVATTEETEPIPMQVQDRRGRGNGMRTPAQRRANLAFLKDAIAAADSRAFEALMAGDAAEVTINLAGNTALQNSLLRTLEANANTPSEVARLRRTLASVSSQNPGSVTIATGFDVSASLNVVDRRGSVSQINLRFS